MSEMDDALRRIGELERRLQTNSETTASLAAVQLLLVEDVKKHAPRDVVEKLDDLTRNQIVPDVAALKAVMSEREGGRAAAIIRAVTAPLKEALRGNVWALLVLVVSAPFILLCVTTVILAVTGQLDEALTAIRGGTRIEAPGSTIDAPNADIRR